MFRDRSGPPKRCTVVDTTRARIVGAFAVEDWPGPTFAGANGWVVALIAHEKGPVGFRELSDSGRTIREFPLPASWQAAVNAAGPAFPLWFPRAFCIDGKLWGIPAGHYGFWRLDERGAGEVKVPPGLVVTDHDLDVSSSSPLVQERLADMPAAMRDRMLGGGDTAPRRGSAAVHISAIRDVAAFGQRVGVLAVVDPEAKDGGCRLDVWSLPASAPDLSVTVPGPCPRNVFIGSKGAWLRVGARLKWLPLALRGGTR